MSTENIADNLRYLCRRRQSVSQICRDLGFNRQQFGRYLNGENRPSIYNLTRICQYFDVTIDDVVLAPEEFQSRIEPPAEEFPASLLPADIVSEILKIPTLGTLDNYVGNYFRYHYAFSFPGYIFRSIFTIRKHGKYYYTKHIERIPRDRGPTRAPLIIKYNGIIIEASSRFFLIERETLKRNAISMTAYAPLLRVGGYLTGIGCSLSTNVDNHPAAARSVLEFVGPRTDLRKMLKTCGLFKPGTSAVSPYIASMIENTNKRTDFTIRAHPG